MVVVESAVANDEDTTICPCCLKLGLFNPGRDQAVKQDRYLIRGSLSAREAAQK
jgi:hypothetical protein